MNKIIINIKCDITHDHAMSMVKSVINEGFISGEKQYCRGTTFTNRQGKSWGVVTKKTRGGTHSFTIYERLDMSN